MKVGQINDALSQKIHQASCRIEKMRELYDVMENIKEELAKKAESNDVDIVNSNLTHFVRKNVFLDLTSKVDGKADRASLQSCINNIELVKAQCIGMQEQCN
jgi:uncharacterized protein YigA (DUF484 family)